MSEEKRPETSEAESVPRLKHHLSAMFSGGTPETSNDDYWSTDESGIAWVAIGDMSGRELIGSTQKRITEAGCESKRLKVLPPGTLIYSIYASLGHVAELVIPATINQALLGFEFKKGVHKQYVKWQLRHLQRRVLEEASSNTQDNLNAEKVRNLPIPLPTYETQVAIADYLDRETARLDGLAAVKGRQLELLAEKRRALINHAVARGPDPDVPLRDSGIPLLGKIPSHWSTLHLKRVLSSMDYGISESVDVAGKIAVLRMGDLQDGEIEYSNVGFVEDVDTSLLLQQDDLLFNRTNSLDKIGKVAIFRGNYEYPVTFASYLVRLRCNTKKALPEFLNILLNSSHVIAWARSEALPAIGQVNLNPNRYAYIPIALPPIPEQRVIIAHILTETSKLNALRAVTESTIALLKERRAALIAAAVTGRIKVV